MPHGEGMNDFADLQEAREILMDLWDWQAQMGGFEAPCWKRARAFLDDQEEESKREEEEFNRLYGD